MNNRISILLTAAIFALGGCKKDAVVGNVQKNIETPLTAKTRIYLVSKMVITHLDSPSPVAETSTFTYNSDMQLTRHTYTYKGGSGSFTSRYTLVYENGKVEEIDRSGDKFYHWDNVFFTYLANKTIILYRYPDKQEIVTILFNARGLVRKMQGDAQFYLFTYDRLGNIRNRSEYDNDNPTTVTFSNDYTYDSNFSPFSAQRSNNYLVYVAFNDINTYFNNRLSDNGLEHYSITYNPAGYPTRVDYLHGPVTVRTVEYSYIIRTQ